MTVNSVHRAATARTASSDVGGSDGTEDVPPTSTPAFPLFVDNVFHNTGDASYDIGHATVGTTRDGDGHVDEYYNNSKVLVIGTATTGATTLAGLMRVSSRGGFAVALEQNAAAKQAKLAARALAQGKEYVAPTLTAGRAIRFSEAAGLVLKEGATPFKIGGITLTPLIVAAFLGSSSADGAGWLVPKVPVVGKKVPLQVRELTGISSIDDRVQAERDNKWAPALRGVIGGAVAGAIGIAVYLKRPDWFQNNVVSKASTALANATPGISKLMPEAGELKQVGLPAGAVPKLKKLIGAGAAVGGVTAVPGFVAAYRYHSTVGDYNEILNDKHLDGGA